MSWDIDGELAVAANIAAARVTDATAVNLSAPFDTRTMDPGDRLLALLVAFETNAANTGGTWTITESATSGGSYAAATLGAALVATPAAAGNDVQLVSILPNPAKPFVKVTYTGVDASTEVDVTAHLLRVPRALVG